MKRWIEKCPTDVEPLLPKMNEFFDKEMARDGYATVLPTLKKSIAEMVNF